LKHQSFGCLLSGESVVAFGTLERDVDLMAADIPIVSLTLSDSGSLTYAMLTGLVQPNLQFVVVDTPLFAYEPILKGLQRKTDFPLAEELLSFDRGQDVPPSSLPIDDVVDKVKASKGRSLESVLNLPKSIDLDPSQTVSLLAGVSQSVSLVQGPPGTGKSFLGALLAKVFLNTRRRPSSC
jgi:Mrp family chromosome partitioning ATPase